MEYSCCHNWYALQTRPRREQSVSTQLTNAGVQVFLPLESVRGSGSRMRATSQRPLFPGYVFCRMNLYSGLRLYMISEIVRIVGYGKQPTPIDDRDMESVRKLALSPYAIESEPAPKTGDTVLMKTGPFAGMSGTLIDIRGAKKFVVSITLLNRAISVPVPPEWITV